ncbi:MAG TPA: phenylalanine--tRNA ligase subunit beta [Candidatus Moranbacteria bacterium]|nr:phenylalanine--tRNA ligase subunit beta [Candidatus Moranbacteria bacterium]
MKYSYQWLKELSGTKKTVRKLAEMVGLKGFEFEGGEEIKDQYVDFCVGRILEIKPHPNADRLQVVKVDIGNRKSSFKKTDLTLSSLKKIREEAEKKGIKTWLLGGLACAFHVGIVYREHSDLDLIVKNKEQFKKLDKLLEELGFKKIGKNKLTDKLSNATYQDEAKIEIDLGFFTGDFGLTLDDFEKKERELNGVRALVLSKRFIKKFKASQLKNRLKSKDRIDWAYLNGKNSGNGLLQVVCGAKNIQTDDWVSVACVGAIVPKSRMKIEATEIRGVKSQGMLCAEDELMLGKNHEGILILERGGEKNSLVKVDKLRPGMELTKALGFNDEILEFSILPNRAHDCLSHIGLAREICAMEGRKLKLKKTKARTTTRKPKILTINVENKKGCTRYMGAVLENIKIKPSPGWMQKRLLVAGMEPINNVVDITNYVMLEVGNPLHAFDLEKIKDDKEAVKIVIRQAKKKENLELLDGKKIVLDESDLLIASGEKPLALAGIKGGLKSGVSEKTTKIVLESAHFSGFGVRKSRQRHSLLTESQARFEKELSPTLAEQAMFRAIELLERYAGAKLLEVVDKNYHQSKKQNLILNLEKAEKLLGEKIKFIEGKAILGNLGFSVQKGEQDKLKVRVPEWRLDIEGVNDLIEEIGRIIGYEKVKAREVITSVEVPTVNQRRDLEWKIKDLMLAQGFDELRNYSFYSKKDAEIFGLDEESHWQIIAPSSEDLALMRLSLAPMMLRKTGDNARYFDEFRIFELARICEKNKMGEPIEKLKLAAVIFNKNLSAEKLFYQMKGALENILENLSVEKFEFKEVVKSRNIFQAGREAVIVINKKEIARLGIIEPKLAVEYSIKKPVVFLDLDFELLLEFLGKKGKIYQPLPKFPWVLRDISLFAPEFTSVESVQKSIRQVAGDSLKKLELFDVFLNQKTKQKSLAFHLSFGQDERTMTGEEVDELMREIIVSLERKNLKVRVN